MHILFLLLFALPSFADWQDHWEPIPESALPALAPDGNLKQFRLALERQSVNCAEEKKGKFKHCGSESSSLGLVCEPGVIPKLLELVKKSKSWDAFYAKAKPAFAWYRYKAGPEQVQFTAYNSPLFLGDVKPGPKFKYPIYARPPDLLTEKNEKGEQIWRRKNADGTLSPYDDRKAIDIEKSLAGKKLEIAYFEFPTDAYRVQIEGSGVLQLPNGKKRGINYAAKNGHTYVSVFKTLREKGVDKKYLSFPGLKQYFLDKPEEFWEAMKLSPSYVFFTLTDEPPCGSARVHVTGGHSIAVDPTQMPLGLVGFLSAGRPSEGTDPEAKNVPIKPFTRFAVAQDTGGAIKGAHVDVYFGTGDYAQLASNSMNTRGELFTMRLKKSAPGKHSK